MNTVEHVLWKNVQSDVARVEIQKVFDHEIATARREGVALGRRQVNRERACGYEHNDVCVKCGWVKRDEEVGR